MTDLRTAAQQALEALQKIYLAPEHDEYIRVWWPACEKAITTLRAAMAQQAGSWQDGVLEGHLRERERWLAQEQAVMVDKMDALRAALAKPAPEPLHEQDIEDAIEAAYWHFDARKTGLNEWASAPQSERDAFKSEARKLAKGYFPTQQAEPKGGGRLPPPLQADPVEPVAWECKAGGLKPLTQRQYDAQTANIRRHYTRIAPPQRKPLSLTDLQEALVLTNLIDRDAIEDPEEYDEGSTLAQIDELHRIIKE